MNKLFFCVLLATSCRFPPTETQPKVIRCGIEAVQQNWPKAIGPVNTCLAGTDDVTACLLALISPVAGITHDVIACVVRKEGSEFTHAARANPWDTRSARSADRAREFLTKQGYQFAENE